MESGRGAIRKNPIAGPPPRRRRTDGQKKLIWKVLHILYRGFLPPQFIAGDVGMSENTFHRYLPSLPSLGGEEFSREW